MEDMRIAAIEEDIIKTLRKGDKVYIENGSLNDAIIDYELHLYEDVRRRIKNIVFQTTGSVFPEKIMLSEYYSVDTEEFGTSLFVRVS